MSLGYAAHLGKQTQQMLSDVHSKFRSCAWDHTRVQIPDAQLAKAALTNLASVPAGGTVVDVLDDIIARGANASQSFVVCIFSWKRGSYLRSTLVSRTLAPLCDSMSYVHHHLSLMILAAVQQYVHSLYTH